MGEKGWERGGMGERGMVGGIKGGTKGRERGRKGGTKGSERGRKGGTKGRERGRDKKRKEQREGWSDIEHWYATSSIELYLNHERAEGWLKAILRMKLQGLYHD